MLIRRRRDTVPSGVDVPDPTGVARRSHGIGIADAFSHLATLLGVARIGVGAAGLAWPVAAVRALGVDTATAARVGWLTRMFAVRDAALGAGLLAASDAGRARTTWLFAAAATDCADLVAMVAATRARRVDRRRGAVFAAGAGGAAALGLASALAGGLARRGRRPDRACREPRRSGEPEQGAQVTRRR